MPISALADFRSHSESDYEGIVPDNENGLVIDEGPINDFEHTEPARQPSEVTHEQVAGLNLVGRILVAEAKSRNVAGGSRACVVCFWREQIDEVGHILSPSDSQPVYSA